MGRIKAIRILPEFPLLNRALTGWTWLPAASSSSRPAPDWLRAPFCSSVLLLSPIWVVTLQCLGTLCAPLLEYLVWRLQFLGQSQAWSSI